jgi:hypothetical protein
MISHSNSENVTLYPFHIIYVNVLWDKDKINLDLYLKKLRK